MALRHTMVALTAIAVAATVTAAVALTSSPSAQAIVGGDEVSEKRSWAVKIIDDGDLICSGVLIGPHWVMTAAHCVNDQPWDELSVRVGGVWRGQGTIRAVKSVNIRSAFRGVGQGNDVALLGLYTAVDEKPIALGERPSVGSTVSMFGYGLVGDDEETRALKEARLEVSGVGTQEFETLGDHATGFPALGDSGAPVVDAHGRLVGIHNRSVECFPFRVTGQSHSHAAGPEDGPVTRCVIGRDSSLHATVAVHRNWIRSVTGIG